MSFHRRKDGYCYVQYHRFAKQRRIYTGKAPTAQIKAQREFSPKSLEIKPQKTQ